MLIEQLQQRVFNETTVKHNSLLQIIHISCKLVSMKVRERMLAFPEKACSLTSLSNLWVCSIYDLVIQTTYMIISLVVLRNPNVRLASAPISINKDILFFENDVKKLAQCGFSVKNLIMMVSKDSPDTFGVTFSGLFTQQLYRLAMKNCENFHHYVGI